MHGTWKLAVAVAAALGITASAEAATSAATPPAAVAAKPPAKAAGPSDRAQIQALEKGFIAAFDAKSVDKIMSYYARDGLFVYDVSPPREYVGWAAYKKDWEGLLAGFPGPVNVDLSELSFTVVGPVAYGHSIQDAHFTTKDGAKIELVVRVTDVYRKLGGKWKIVQEHVSVPVDLDTGKPDLLSKP